MDHCTCFFKHSPRSEATSAHILHVPKYVGTQFRSARCESGFLLNFHIILDVANNKLFTMLLVLMNSEFDAFIERCVQLIELP